jgi:uncharacterized protein YgfB (UPF0149 family)
METQVITFAGRAEVFKSVPSLPDFENTLVLAQGDLDASELAECHGVLCGLLCRTPDSTADDYLRLLDELSLTDQPGPALRVSLQELHSGTRDQLADEGMSLSLWLPRDDEPLEDRILAMGQWCTGFLAGIGSGPQGRLDTLSEDAAGAIRDIQQIALAEFSGDSESEEDEVAFTEIEEYLRVVTLMLREDLRGPGGEDHIH